MIKNMLVVDYTYTHRDNQIWILKILKANGYDVSLVEVKNITEPHRYAMCGIVFSDPEDLIYFKLKYHGMIDIKNWFESEYQRIHKAEKEDSNAHH